MAEYRTIRMSFWNDPFIEELEAEEKLLYLYLFSCPHTSNLGVLEISRRRMAFECALTVNTVQKGLDKLCAAGKVVIDGNFILLTRFIKNQTTTSPKILESLKGMLEEVPSLIIRRELCIRYPHIFEGCEVPEIPFNNPSDTVSIPCAYPADTVCIPSRAREEEREEEREREKEEEVGKGRGESACAGARVHTREEKTPPDQKLPFGEYGQVKLFQREYDRLCEKYGRQQTEDAIAFLDLHISSKGKDPYKNHCAALQKWVYDAVARQRVERQKARDAPFPHGLSDAERRQAHNDAVCRQVAAELDAMGGPF